MQETAIVVAVLMAGYACRTFSYVILRKLGALLYLAATYLAGFFLFGSHLAGACCVLGWFLLPWVDILLRIRTMQMPLQRPMRENAIMPRAELPEITGEVQALGFELVDDISWDLEGMQQFVRLFVHPEKKFQAAIHLHQQHGTSISFVSITARDGFGSHYTTWNYPFGNPMKLPPGFVVNRLMHADSFEHLFVEHEYFLSERGMDVEILTTPDPEQLPQVMEKEFRQQVDHNLGVGILSLAGEGRFRYSWRGCFFLWGQFLKDMVRLS
jgi:uncharacterized RmlC-like cupin family protein